MKMFLKRRSTPPNPLVPLLEEWRKAKAKCLEIARRMDDGEAVDFEEYMALRDDRKEAADRAVEELQRQMDAGYARVPDTGLMLGAMDDSKQGRCCE